METNLLERVDNLHVNQTHDESIKEEIVSPERLDSVKKREVLRPYKRKRLGFEGVFIHAIEPNRKNGYTYGLVFGSIYAPNEKIELDHAVIKVSIAEYNQANLELYQRYYFSAEVDSYYKTGYVLGIAAKREHFMLTHINVSKMYKLSTSVMTQPTMYVISRIRNVLSSKNIEPRHTEEELLEIIYRLPNDGSVERFVDTYTKNYQHKKVTTYDIIETLYA